LEGNDEVVGISDGIQIARVIHGRFIQASLHGLDLEDDERIYCLLTVSYRLTSH